VKEPSCPPIIGLNKSIIHNTKLHTCVLAEEVGHYYTTVGDCISLCYSFNDRIVITKKEKLAMKWAVEYLIPMTEIMDTVKEGLSIADLPVIEIKKN